MNIKKILYAQKYHYSAVSKMLEMVVKKVNQNEITLSRIHFRLRLRVNHLKLIKLLSFNGYVRYLGQSISLQIFKRLSSTNFTWSMREYFASFTLVLIAV